MPSEENRGMGMLRSIDRFNVVTVVLSTTVEMWIVCQLFISIILLTMTRNTMLLLLYLLWRIAVKSQDRTSADASSDISLRQRRLL